MMANHSTPEELLSAPKGPPLEIELACNRCGDSAKHEFAYALVNPEIEEHRTEDWDGVLLPRIIECKRCGAVDDYKLGSRSRMMLMAEILRVAFSEENDLGSRAGGRVIVGISKLWDGTIAHRPSQALSHLRKLVEQHPGSGEAWRRLGNAEERFGQVQQAETSWRKALEVDPKELESAFSLTKYLAECDRWPEAFGFLRTGIRLLPQSRDIDPAHRLGLSKALVEMLRRVIQVSREPFALMAGWSGSQTKEAAVLNMSSVDVRKIENWDRLSEFLISPEVMAAELTAELPGAGDEPTILQRRLAGEWAELPRDTVRSQPQSPVINAAARIGRNAPCPCGSGKKYKKCCGR